MLHESVGSATHCVIALTGGAGRLLDDFVCVWSGSSEILSRSFLQSLAQLCGMAFCKTNGYSVDAGLT